MIMLISITNDNDDDNNDDVDIWFNFPRTWKMVKMWLFLFFWSSAVTKLFDFNRGILKMFSFFVLAHMEPELELFKVWEIMVPQSSSPSSPMSSTSNSSSLGSR